MAHRRDAHGTEGGVASDGDAAVAHRGAEPCDNRGVHHAAEQGAYRAIEWIELAMDGTVRRAIGCWAGVDLRLLSTRPRLRFSPVW